MSSSSSLPRSERETLDLMQDRIIRRLLTQVHHIIPLSDSTKRMVTSILTEKKQAKSGADPLSSTNRQLQHGGFNYLGVGLSFHWLFFIFSFLRASYQNNAAFYSKHFSSLESEIFDCFETTDTFDFDLMRTTPSYVSSNHTQDNLTPGLFTSAIQTISNVYAWGTGNNPPDTHSLVTNQVRMAICPGYIQTYHTLDEYLKPDIYNNTVFRHFSNPSAIEALYFVVAGYTKTPITFTLTGFKFVNSAIVKSFVDISDKHPAVIPREVKSFAEYFWDVSDKWINQMLTDQLRNQHLLRENQSWWQTADTHLWHVLTGLTMLLGMIRIKIPLWAFRLVPKVMPSMRFPLKQPRGLWKPVAPLPRDTLFRKNPLQPDILRLDDRTCPIPVWNPVGVVKVTERPSGSAPNEQRVQPIYERPIGGGPSGRLVRKTRRRRGGSCGGFTTRSRTRPLPRKPKDLMGPEKTRTTREGTEERLDPGKRF
jgi:hypothetical protein